MEVEALADELGKLVSWGAKWDRLAALPVLAPAGQVSDDASDRVRGNAAVEALKDALERLAGEYELDGKQLLNRSRQICSGATPRVGS